MTMPIGKELAELEAQASELQDEITLGKIQGDAIRSCIERLINANLYKDANVLRANMKATTASVSKIYDIELATVISEMAEKIRELEMREHQKELLLNGGGNLFFGFTSDSPKLSELEIAPVEQSEKHLKKLIKHAKTPMERKAYEKQLNELYKKRKKRRNGYLL